jgi:hypothetical protein
MKLSGRPAISWGSFPLTALHSNGRGSGGTGGMPAGSESALPRSLHQLLLCRLPYGRSAGVRNDQPSPEGGARPPPLGGYRHALPLPPRGRGRRPKAGRGRGAALQSITSSSRGTKRRKAARIENNFIILSVLTINMTFGALLWPLEKVK